MWSLFLAIFRVTQISWMYHGVQVRVENGKVFTADAAIITVPLGVLKSNVIKFEPKLPEWKEAAIADLGVGIENKIILRFEKVFWPSVEFLGVVAPSTYECGYFLNLHKATGYPVLVYMPAGRLADDIEKLSDEAAASFAFSQLKRIFPDATDPVKLYFSKSFHIILVLFLFGFSDASTVINFIHFRTLICMSLHKTNKSACF